MAARLAHAMGAHVTVLSHSLIAGRRKLSGSIKENQEMLKICGKHDVVSQSETIGIQEINEAYERVLKSDVRYRFVIDMASLAA